MINELTYFEVLQRAFSFLETNSIEPHIAEYLMIETNNWSKTDLILNFKKQAPPEFVKHYQSDLKKIVKHIPVQYIIGSCEFYGRRFSVSESTLIPRPETEELVEKILKENKQTAMHVVDMGTGTGIIAITLKLERPNWDITGVDISTKALEIAKENKEKLNASVAFCESNVLSQLSTDKKIDLLVSNPPYISMDEWETMDKSVRQYEPKEALFAENNGLAIYQQLASEAKEKLAQKGKIYLEIGHTQAVEVSRIFQEAFPEKKVSVIKDMNGKDRIIKVI